MSAIDKDYQGHKKAKKVARQQKTMANDTSLTSVKRNNKLHVVSHG